MGGNVQKLLGCCGMVLLISYFVDGRKHFLKLEDDPRRLFTTSTFGYFQNGYLEVHMHEFSIRPKSGFKPAENKIGLTLDRTLSGGINPYSQNLESSRCTLNDDAGTEADRARFSRVVFLLDFDRKKITIKCDPELSNLMFFKSTSNVRSALYEKGIGFRAKRDVGENDNDDEMPKPDQDKPSSSTAVPQINVKSSVSAEPGAKPSLNEDKIDDSYVPNPDVFQQPDPKVAAPGYSRSDSVEEMKAAASEPEKKLVNPPMDSNSISDGYSCHNDIEWDLYLRNEGSRSVYSFNFTVFMENPQVEGLYNLFFHNCYGVDTSIDLNMSITEVNEGDNYLSAGEMPLPSLYFMMSVVFFITGLFWIYVLKKSRKESNVAVFKIHYLMGALVFLKSLSLLFHAINFHYIQVIGTHFEGVAVLYYTVHLIKGALLFITLLLIGTGYAFIKHLLSDKEKRIFMIVIPLQVLANVANIIIEESEEGESKYATWRVIFYSLDLLCCGAILFPVIWSIRHLQEASNTDGKAATNLRKLKLFRHFYIIVVCYIYFTRIIVNLLLKITIQFQYEWLDEMFLELATFVFYVLVGYKFRPAANNPYLELAHDSDDEGESGVALTESGLLDGVSKRGRGKKKTLQEIIYFDDDSDDDEEVLLDNRGEVNSSSKDFVTMTLSNG